MEKDKIKDLIKDAEAILVGAGAGMSIPAGIDLMNEEEFKKNYPAMLQYSFTYGYQLMGYPYKDERLKWGYLSASLHDMFSLGKDPTYQKLLKLLIGKDYFILTSNVDRLFYKNGFDPDRIYTPQGDSSLFQCKTPCHDGIWDAKPIVKEMLEFIDPDTQYMMNEELIPRCPVCGGEVYMNVRSGSFYIEKNYEEGRSSLNEWIVRNKNKKMLLLEIGVGFNTPGIIRYPFENLTKQLPNATLIRINPNQNRVPANAYSLPMTIEDFLS